MSSDDLSPMNDWEMNGESLDIAEQRRQELKQLFPGVFTETTDGKGNVVETVDFERLKAELGTFSDVYEGRRERYGMDWPGKRDCMKLIQEPSRATLKPCREESVDFDSTKNLFIEGDNLEALKLLQKSYYGKVKMVYIDPPYNTGNEFIYPDKYSESLDTYLAYAGLVDDHGKRFSTNTATEGRFHTNWLNMIYPRLYLSKNLMTKDGVILISIDEHELENLTRVCDEVFGEENKVATIVWKGSTDNNPTRVAIEHEYIVCYAKNIDECSGVWKSRVSDGKELILAEYDRLSGECDDAGSIQKDLRKFIKDNAESLPSLTHYNRVDDSGPYTGSRKVHNPKPGGYVYDVLHDATGKPCVMPANGYRYPQERMNDLLSSGRVLFGDDETQIIQIKEYLRDYEEKLPSVINLDSRAGANEIGRLLGNRKVFTNPKPYELLSFLFDFLLEDGDVLLDYFAGSCASAQAVLELNSVDNGKRKYIMVQLPEKLSDKVKEHKSAITYCEENNLKRNIAEISKSRLSSLCQKYSNTEAGDGVDVGYKVLKLAASSFKAWDPNEGGDSSENIADQLEMHVEHIHETASQEDILYELLVKAGFMPTDGVEALSVGEKKLFSVAEGALLICLENELTVELIDGVADLEPMQFICLDRGFKGNDQLKANAVQTFKSRSQNSDSEMVFKVV
ncbi:MAG: site-specific DNA-methyltransferase [Candidatus Thiodiazotropha endolucinida]|nr:site-specific DNA-methyltransferase [Candidatus Thiodiazotropha taylori]MCW4261080.1 site-specific DNA-methyltransferase [Candidatus Thiodiazotropha endolucinida]MCG8102344.1 site-specific DNA-methyltransferase [Candidatus Thiodiazotropha taylori]MCG8120894.1 site-specific DNA-methyltransferase [Candidatus Thiodiazotropha taylori]MCW4287667.1 site-specific DNA-methyltransferase [Candidatus Thiodiazotropha endolucinida]